MSRRISPARLGCATCRWACNRILTISIGVTTMTASVTPAASPASRDVSSTKTSKSQSLYANLPKRRCRPPCDPPGGSKSHLYVSKLANRIAILGTMPMITGLNPRYKPSTESFLMIDRRVLKAPRFPFSCKFTLMVSDSLED